MSLQNRKLYSTIFIFVTLLAPGVTIAQKIKLVSGSLAVLKNESALNIRFTYDSMIVGVDTPERKYLQQKKSDWEIKEPGKGSEFIHQWFDDREEYYEPAFKTSFEEYSKRELTGKKSKYTVIVQTQRTEGGWYAGVMGHPGEIDGELHVIETSDPIHILAIIEFREIHGKALSGGDFEMYLRIQDAYTVAGKWLGDFVRKKSK